MKHTTAAIRDLLSRISSWPWSSIDEETCNQIVIHGNSETGRDYEDEILTEVARVWKGEYDKEVHYSEKEDAKFIAAAPELISTLLEQNAVMRDALEYYADIDGGPYASGDYHTADGGKKAQEALEHVKKLEGES